MVLKKSSKAKAIVEFDGSQKSYNNLRSVVDRKLQKYIGQSWRGRLLFLPDFAVLLGRILVDPRSPAGRKILAGAAIGYLVLPTDFTPDFIPIIGMLDDMAFLLLTVREILKSTPIEIVQEHWPNPDVEMLEALEDGLQKVRDFLPERVWRRWMARRIF